jgi:hypothetical protein
MPFAATAQYPNAVAGVNNLLNHQNKVPSVSSPTLAAPMGSGDTSFSVNSGGGAAFPTDNFVVSVDNEIIFIASRSSDTCTVGARGYEGTTAASHLLGATVEARITALAHNQLAAEVNAVETALGANLSAVVALAIVLG